MLSKVKKIFLSSVSRKELVDAGRVKLVKKTYRLVPSDKPITIEITRKDKIGTFTGEDDFFTVNEAVKASGLNRNQVYYYKNKHEFKWKKENSQILIEKNSFNRFFLSRFGEEE